jgi:hypothetical protein
LRAEHSDVHCHRVGYDAVWGHHPCENPNIILNIPTTNREGGAPKEGYDWFSYCLTTPFQLHGLFIGKRDEINGEQARTQKKTVLF